MGVWDDLVSEWFARTLPKATPRRVRTRAMPGKADALIGMRRSGKTWLLLGEIAAARASGTPEGAILYASLEDERLRGVDARDLGGLVEAWFRRFPEVATEPVWLVLDEVQLVPGWEQFTRRMLDTGRMRVAVTGSSSRLLSREIATAMRGRSLASEVLPYAFDEWLHHRGLSIPGRWPPSPAERATLANALDVYLETGGFPELVGASASNRTDTLRDYVDVVLLRDVVERHGDANLPALRRLVGRFVSTPGSAFSVHKLYNDLRSQGLAIGKDTLHAYADHVEDAFLGFRVPILTESERVRATNPAKLYPVDTGLARAFAARVEPGRLLETAVYLELRRRRGEIAWMRTKSGYEVDFAVRGDAGTALVQACADWTDAATRDREIRALDEAMAEVGTRDAVVVTLSERDEVRRPDGTIRVVPAWEWLVPPGRLGTG